MAGADNPKDAEDMRRFWEKAVAAAEPSMSEKLVSISEKLVEAQALTDSMGRELYQMRNFLVATWSAYETEVKMRHDEEHAKVTKLVTFKECPVGSCDKFNRMRQRAWEIMG